MSGAIVILAVAQAAIAAAVFAAARRPEAKRVRIRTGEPHARR